MAHNSNNLSIGRSKLGAPRFPFERSDAGDGYAASSPVVTRQTTPEEKAKYGPVKAQRQRPDNRLSAEKIQDALLGTSSVKEAAEILHVHPQRLKLRMAELGIKREEEGEKEVAAFETYPGKEPAKTYQPDKPKPQETAVTGSSSNEEVLLQANCQANINQWHIDEINAKHDNNTPVSDDDEVSWVTPRKPAKEISILRLCSVGITLNVHAHRMLRIAGAEYVRIGSTKTGTIILARAESEKGAFKLGHQKDGANKIGGGALVEGLKKSGAKEGRYVLERNEARGWWEARADGQL